MIIYTKGDLFDAQTEAIINTVNTVGIMGKGIALQFRKLFKHNYDAYVKACKEDSFKIGDLLITENNSLYFKYIINFPTKKHWKQPSKYEYIEEGLNTLVTKIKELEIKSLALPPLGSGNGNLDWDKVKQIIEQYLGNLSDVQIFVYEPQTVFEERDNKKTFIAKLTPIRAMLIHVFRKYERADSSLNLLVTQKLAYFLQRFGEPLNLKYEKGPYGPFAPNLNKLLQAINGTYIQYKAQDNSPINTVSIIEEKLSEVFLELEKVDIKQKNRLERLLNFIDGFQTPFSLEILATVDWILRENITLTKEQVYQQIGQWTKRKAELISQHHVNVAFNHLEKFELLNN